MRFMPEPRVCGLVTAVADFDGDKCARALVNGGKDQRCSALPNLLHQTIVAADLCTFLELTAHPRFPTFARYFHILGCFNGFVS